MARHFTRAQVEARCLEIHPPTDEREIVRVQDVRLLEGTPIPLWMVTFLKIHREATPFEYTFKGLEVYTEERVGDKLVLLPYTGVTLPTGCATAEEEDRAIEAKRKGSAS